MYQAIQLAICLTLFLTGLVMIGCTVMGFLEMIQEVGKELWSLYYNKERELPALGYKQLKLPYFGSMNLIHVPERERTCGLLCSSSSVLLEDQA